MSFKWLVIGIGDVTRRRVIPAILEHSGSSLYAVLTRDPAKAQAYPGVRPYTSLEDALSDKDIDGVYVASPVALHAPHTLASLRAGKHVLCEKPMAMNYAEAEAMVAAGRDADGLLGVAYYRRLYPKVQRTRQLIADGAIGQPVLAEANCHSWLPPSERNWLWSPALSGGGPLYDIGSHRIDVLNYLFGRPLRVTGLLSNAVHKVPVEDSATVVIEYAGGLHGVVDVRWNSHTHRDQFRIIGTDGEINLDPLGGPILRINGVEEALPAHSNFHFPAIENFVNATVSGAPLICPAAEAMQTDWVISQVSAWPLRDNRTESEPRTK